MQISFEEPLKHEKKKPTQITGERPQGAEIWDPARIPTSDKRRSSVNCRVWEHPSAGPQGSSPPRGLPGLWTLVQTLVRTLVLCPW